MIEPIKIELVLPEYRHPKATPWTPPADRPVLFIERACKVFGTSIYDLKNNRTFPTGAQRRRAFAHVAHDSLGWPMHQIRQALGLKCHSGICKMIKRSRADASACADYANMINALEVAA